MGWMACFPHIGFPNGSPGDAATLPVKLEAPQFNG
jgi:hypothetical protein